MGTGKHARYGPLGDGEAGVQVTGESPTSDAGVWSKTPTGVTQTEIDEAVMTMLTPCHGERRAFLD
jgi:hypothetical protein